jgi:hypothetical protein
MQDSLGQQDMLTEAVAWALAQHAEATHATQHYIEGDTDAKRKLVQLI